MPPLFCLSVCGGRKRYPSPLRLNETSSFLLCAETQRRGWVCLSIPSSGVTVAFVDISSCHRHLQISPRLGFRLASSHFIRYPPLHDTPSLPWTCISQASTRLSNTSTTNVCQQANPSRFLTPTSRLCLRCQPSAPRPQPFTGTYAKRQRQHATANGSPPQLLRVYFACLRLAKKSLLSYLLRKTSVTTFDSSLSAFLSHISKNILRQPIQPTREKLIFSQTTSTSIH